MHVFVTIQENTLQKHQAHLIWWRMVSFCTIIKPIYNTWKQSSKYRAVVYQLVMVKHATMLRKLNLSYKISNSILYFQDWKLHGTGVHIKIPNNYFQWLPGDLTTEYSQQTLQLTFCDNNNNNNNNNNNKNKNTNSIVKGLLEKLIVAQLINKVLCFLL
jgi:disulfide oxidoreductase YuzD